mmetsp:Transcript_60494/g.169544  ORF Transcript_60494/g.169544 Transcript_60494/m.169544 type:complete len:296 (-) Transcript_60494:71-958(-)
MGRASSLRRSLWACCGDRPVPALRLGRTISCAAFRSMGCLNAPDCDDITGFVHRTRLECRGHQAGKRRPNSCCEMPWIGTGGSKQVASGGCSAAAAPPEGTGGRSSGSQSSSVLAIEIASLIADLGVDASLRLHSDCASSDGVSRCSKLGVRAGSRVRDGEAASCVSSPCSWAAAAASAPGPLQLTRSTQSDALPSSAALLATDASPSTGATTFGVVVNSFATNGSQSCVMKAADGKSSSGEGLLWAAAVMEPTAAAAVSSAKLATAAAATASVMFHRRAPPATTGLAKAVSISP